jgi:ESCRT-II complex subunit
LLSSEIATNQAINRKLTNQSLQIIIDYMIANGTAEYVTNLKDKIYIHATSIQEYAAAIYQWVYHNLGKGYWKNEPGYIFYNAPPELMLKACKALEREKKAEVFCSEKTKEYGVKFFYM